MTPSVAQAVQPGRYALDTTSSRVNFTVRKLGVPVHGQFRSVLGVLEISADVGRCSVVATVPAAGFDTGNPRRDAHVLSGTFLDAEHHRFLRFHSTGVRPSQDGCWTVSGQLTVRGVTRPIDLRVHRADSDGSAGRLHLRAVTTIRRSDFGVGAFGWLVGDQVKILIEVAADLQPSPGPPRALPLRRSGSSGTGTSGAAAVGQPSPGVGHRAPPS